MAARTETKQKPDREELVRQLTASRVRLGRDLEGMLYELDVKSKLKRSVARNSGTWVAGAAASGLILALLPGKRKERKKQSRSKHSKTEIASEQVSPGKRQKLTESLLIDVFKTIFPVMKPLLIALATRKVGAMAANLEKSN